MVLLLVTLWHDHKSVALRRFIWIINVCTIQLLTPTVFWISLICTLSILCQTSICMVALSVIFCLIDTQANSLSLFVLSSFFSFLWERCCVYVPMFSNYPPNPTGGDICDSLHLAFIIGRKLDYSVQIGQKMTELNCYSSGVNYVAIWFSVLWSVPLVCIFTDLICCLLWLLWVLLKSTISSLRLVCFGGVYCLVLVENCSSVFEV